MIGKIFGKKFSRRNFVTASTKIFAAAMAFGLSKKMEAKFSPSEDKIIFPQVTEFKTLDELKIGNNNLRFRKMDLRVHTGAIIIHHAGMERDREMTLQEIHELHLKNSWAGAGYHFVIHKNGFIEEARPTEYEGAHCHKNNEFTLGVCLTGNYDLAQPPTPQIKSAVSLLAALCEKYEIPPAEYTIIGHRDLNKTSCPGKNLYPLLPKIIQNVSQIYIPVDFQKRFF